MKSLQSFHSLEHVRQNLCDWLGGLGQIVKLHYLLIASWVISAACSRLIVKLVHFSSQASQTLFNHVKLLKKFIFDIKQV